MNDTHMIFLKLGGSLITDKRSPKSSRPEIIRNLVDELAAVLTDRPDMKLLIGHGSGSFGHIAAKKFQTREGVDSQADWLGFAQVWKDANELNRIVMDHLHDASLPAIAFPPSSSAIAHDGSISSWNTSPILKAINAGLLPVIHGDVVFDSYRGGTIISTEELFSFLTPILKPRKILLAGIEPGVWLDYPICTKIAQQITPNDLSKVTDILQGSESIDVTGGMFAKVHDSMKLIQSNPELEILIFSGLEQGNLTRALRGDLPGTLLYIDSQSDLD